MSKIAYFVAVGIKGPIKDGEYTVENAKVSVSYPEAINVGYQISLPKGLSTFFQVTWDDVDDKDASNLRSESFARHLPLYKALRYINEITLAYKLVRIGHLDGMGLRTIGIGDTLFSTSKIDEEFTGNVTVGFKQTRRVMPGFGDPKADLDDPLGTTRLALPHIAASSYPVARRYVRCYELLEHGFYSEAFIVAFSILDDLVQQMLDSLLLEKGMSDSEERKSLVRGIKENRLRVFLGPLLKVIAGHSIEALWPAGDKALDWLNATRNKIAHAGFKADNSTAAKGIFVCIKTLHLLHEKGLINAEFDVGMYRAAKHQASWTGNPPPWVPPSEVALGACRR
ncbi:MAG: hypothetical protein WAO35_28685 [Terriglobia bacterium]